MYPLILAITLLLSSVWGAPPPAPPLPSDWTPAVTPALYDWRHTRWCGIGGGNITGAGLSCRIWEDRHGWQVTLLPFYADGDLFVVAGGARLLSINQPAPESAGTFGFTTRHYYGFFSTAHGYSYDSFEGGSYIGALGAGVGMDLDRRASRFSLLLGLGPYLELSRSGRKSLEIYPAFEASWQFGLPRRSPP